MKLKRFAALPTIMVVAAASHPGVALATDFSIGGGQTETSTQALTAAGDTLSVDKGGKVSTTGAHAVELSAADQRVTNRGTLEALSGHDGIFGNADATGARISNYGTISTTGMLAYAVHLQGVDNELVNFGGLYVYADCAYGVYAEGDYFSLTNNGTIASKAEATSYGVYLENANYATIVNNGLISTIGTDADGITVYGGDLSITNTGTVSTSNADSIGIYVWHGSASGTVLVNTGTIHTSGEGGSQAIYANAPGATVINSGTVISEHAEAFYMGRSDQTLTLLSGSRIFGGIRFDYGPSATLNIGRGLDARLTLDGIPGTITTDGQLWVLDDTDPAAAVLAVVSPETVAGGSTAATTTTGAVAGTISNHIGARRSGGAADSAPLAYAPAVAGPAFPDFAPDDEYGVWTSAYGTILERTGAGGGRASTQGGALAGFDTRLSEDSLAGIYAGFGRGVVMAATGGSSTETTSLMGGAYASFSHGPVFVDVNASIGATVNRSTRNLINNLVAGGIETATADYTGFFVSPSVKVGIDHDIGAARLTPSVSLLYAGIYQPGYSETGSSANLSFGAQSTHVLTARAELELGTLDQDDVPGGWSGSFKLGADGTVTNGSAVSATLIGAPLEFAASTNLEARGFAGLNIEYATGGTTFAATSEVGLSTTGILSASIQGGIGAKF